MRKIAIANQKGGCGKTTTAINLSACLAERGRRVLLIDLDPQAHATLGLKGNPEDLEKNMYDVLSDSSPPATLEEVTLHILPNLDLAPSSVILSALEQELSGRPGRELRLYNAVQSLSTPYNYLIIDCPPSIGLLTFNALRACDEVIVPIETCIFSLHGVEKLLETTRVLSERAGHKTKVKALATIYDRRTKLAKEILKRIKEHFEGRIFNSAIHTNVKLREAALKRVPISRLDRSATGYKDYRQLTQEIIGEEVRAERMESKFFGPQVLEDGVFFSYRIPDAEDVQLVGDFNDWKMGKDAQLEKGEDGRWSRILRLGPGGHEYRLVVNGKWLKDPHNPQVVSNPFGEENSLIVVP